MRIRTSIKNKLVLSFLVFMIPLIGIGVVGHLAWYQARRWAVVEKHVEAARGLAILVESYVKDKVDAEVLLGMVATGKSPSQIKKLVADIRQRNPAFVSMAYLSPAGLVIAADPSKPAGTSFAGETPVQEVRRGEAWAVGDLRKQKSRGIPTFPVAVGVRKGQQLSAIVAGEVRIDHLAKLAALQVGDRGKPVIADTFGHALVGESGENPDWELKQGAGLEDVREALRGMTVAVSGTWDPIIRAKAVGGSVPVRSIGWVARIVQPEGIAMAHAREAVSQAGTLLAILILLMVGIAWFLGDRFTRPVRALIRSSISLSRGNLEDKIEIWSGDELEQLARSFDKMRESLRRTIGDARDKAERLRVIQEITRSISSTLDLRDIFQIVANQIGRLVPNDSSSLALYNREDDTFRVSVSRTTDGKNQLTEGIDLASTDPILRRVAESREPLVWQNVEELNSPIARVLHEEGIQSCVSMPILSGDICLGVLNLGSHRTDGFSQDQVEILCEIADHVAVAVENAQLYEQAERQKVKLEQLAQTDSLTGVHNRQHFEGLFEREVERAKRYGTKLAVVMIDINEFKMVNDTLGHRAGDDVLQAMGDILKKTSRTADIPARYGGDEFVVAMPETDSEGAAQAVAKWRDELSAKHHAGELPIPITISVGVSAGFEGSYQHLLEEADRLMYEEKRQYHRLSRRPAKPS